MIPYEELAAALEGQRSAPAHVPSIGTGTLQEAGPLDEPSQLAQLEDPTLNGRDVEAGPELEIGDMISDEEAS